MTNTNRQSRKGPADPKRYDVALVPRRVVLSLSVITLMLLLCHVGLTLYHYEFDELPWLPSRQLFDVDEENNLPIWFSGFLLSIVAACSWLCARRKRDDKDSCMVHWYALAIGFLFPSLDEVSGIHETINSLIEMSSAILGGILATGVGFAYIPFLRQLPSGARTLFFSAGAL